MVLLEVYIPDLVGPAPSWVYYSFAFGMWMYSTMDNVDGKQARRTGTSSPLGELFEYVMTRRHEPICTNITILIANLAMV